MPTNKQSASWCRPGYVLLPPELSDADPQKAAEKQMAFARKTKEEAAPAKA